MESITIHDLEDDLATALEDLAIKQNVSQELLIKGLLKEALGITEEADTSEQSIEKAD